ncbi:MAG: tetratricopeptide repeat protein [Gammaproteobacteria bacterium]|nr:tetratricopeptide repeat protein [Gammaproteobacteria bacterium]MDH5727736.1 tetratricopeptide repeat protein [Gammaproteobacteria bacterium]
MSKTEEEQIEDLKRWWEKNGKFVIIALIVVVAATVGGRTWQDYRETKMLNASNEYAAMMNAVEAGQGEEALQKGSRLIEQYAQTQYAVLAALVMAKADVEKNDLAAAEKHLSWVLDNSQDENFKHIARTRLARVLIAVGKIDAAISQAEVADKGAYADTYSMIKGDAYVAKGDLAMARNAYETALAGKDLTPQMRQLLQMKLDDVSSGANKVAAEGMDS